MLYAYSAARVLSKGEELRDGHAVTAAVRDTNFTGVADTVVALDSKGDRIESYEVMNNLVGEDRAEYKGMTFKASTTGFQLQEYKGGYMFCSKYSEVAFTIESSEDACKDKCRRCSLLTYYAGFESQFSKRCYVFQSAVECGRLKGYKDGAGSMWSVPVGAFDSMLQEYEAYKRAVVWPGKTMEVPLDYSSGERLL